jgi:hypothetical protein
MKLTPSSTAANGNVDIESCCTNQTDGGALERLGEVEQPLSSECGELFFLVIAIAGRIAMKTIVPIVTAVVLALALMPASAASTHHKRHSKGAAAAQPQIACTVVGCMPVPRGCHPEMGYTPDGTPTGFDVVVCPNYTLYGRNISNY